MKSNVRVDAPGGFAPAFGLGFTDSDGNLSLIGPANPLPVSGATTAFVTTSSPLEGGASTNKVVGPFVPVAGRAIYLQLDGAWTGEVRLLRSTDKGTTKSPVTVAGAPWAVFQNNVLEPVWEESEAGAELYLELAPTSGTIVYRVSQ